MSGVLGGNRMFWRIYLHGVGLLVLVAIAIGVTGAVVGRAPLWHGYGERLSRYLTERSSQLVDNPAIVEEDLRRERELLGLEMSLYGVDGRLLATNVEPPVPALDEHQIARIRHGAVPIPGRRWGVGAPVFRDGRMIAYAVSGPFSAGPQFTRAATVLAVVLLVLALGSIPLARGMTRPLETLTSAAQRLGAGELSVRTGLRRNDEVGRLAEAFDEMADRLEKLVRGEKELLANVSHELRTPLARIRVALEIAEEGDPARAQAYLREIGTDLGELERLIDEVMTVARLDLGDRPAGTPPLNRVPVEPAEVVQAAAARFQAAHPSRTLEVTVGAGLPTLDADPAMLRRVLDNLLDNARKYSDESTPIALGASAGDGEVRFEVRDRGIGIDEADVPRLFTPFFRSDRSRARGTGGVGLGLTLARRIVEAHGGRISVESRPGKGTSVRFQIPAMRAA